MDTVNHGFLVLSGFAVFLIPTLCVVPLVVSAGNQESQIGQKTREILQIFEEISAIPRCSKHERHLSKWLKKWAKNHGFEARSDAAGNVLVILPATPGYEKAPGIVIQGHMDMVCEKTPDSTHNFSKDPIRLVYEGDWLRADKTTLGADNGIGIAIGLALLTDGTVPHPPLEVLLTVGEESGFTGVNAMKDRFLRGRILLNLDSEREGTFTVGGAGGSFTVIELPFRMKSLSEDDRIVKLRAHGMRGGHSGVDIHKHRANAIKVLARALHELNRSSGIRLVSIEGGTVANAIPREAEALVAFDPMRFATLQKVASEFEKALQEEYASTEKSLALTLSESETKASLTSALVHEDTNRVIDLLLSLPNGVAAMSADLEGVVETSNNLGVVGMTGKSVNVVSFQRSSVMSALEEITAAVEETATRTGAKGKTSGTFPPWEPDMKSPLLKQCKEVYRAAFGTDPHVSIVHGGLECSVIGVKYPEMDMISLGPTIVSPHSPDEKLHIPSVQKAWDFLVALLKSYGT